MSKLEESVQKSLLDTIPHIERHRKLTLAPPWSNATYVTPDLYIPDHNFYIEVKGYMTIEAMMKIVWIAKNSLEPYFLFQATEVDWFPHLYSEGTTKKSWLERNFAQQVHDIKMFHLHRYRYMNPNEVTIRRIEAFIEKKIADYEHTTGTSFPTHVH